MRLLTTVLALHRDPRGTGLDGPSSKGAGAAPAALEQVLTHLWVSIWCRQKTSLGPAPFSKSTAEYSQHSLFAPQALLGQQVPGQPNAFPSAELPSDTHCRLLRFSSWDELLAGRSSHMDSMFLLQSSWGNTQTQYSPGITPSKELKWKADHS